MSTFKKSILAAICLLGSTFAAMAQNPNEVFNLHISPLNYQEPSKDSSVGSVLGSLAQAAAGQTANNRHPEVVPYVNAIVKTAFADVRRLSPVDDKAAFELSGDVVSAITWTKSTTTEKKDSKGKVVKNVTTYHYASVAVSLTLTDTADGHTWTHKFSAGGDYSYKSEGAAIEAALNVLQGKIVKYFNNLFPLTAHIVDRGNEKKDKTKEVYIDLGSEIGIFKGQHFKVCVTGEKAGHATEQRIGKIKVEEVLGPDISLCKVQGGKKEIKEALDNGATLTITSYD